MRSHSDWGSDKVLKSTCFAWVNLNHIINSCGKKMIDICYVGSGVKCHPLSYWSIVMMPPVEFSTSQFCAKPGKKNKGLLESLSTPWVDKKFVSKMIFFPFLDIDLRQSLVTSRELKILVWGPEHLTSCFITQVSCPRIIWSFKLCWMFGLGMSSRNGSCFIELQKMDSQLHHFIQSVMAIHQP